MFKDFYNALIDENLKSQASFVEFGFGQVEPNHLSAQRTGQIYTQLPANKDIKVLEQGQFVKYDYAANENGIGEVNFEGAGEWMLVFNEIKLYKKHWDGSKQWDCEFAMVADDYQARIYTPYDWEAAELKYQTRFLNGVDAEGNASFTLETNVDARTMLDDEDNKVVFVEIDGERILVEGDAESGTFKYNDKTYTLEDGKCVVSVEHFYDDFTADVRDIYEMNFTNDPYRKLGIYREKKMPKGTSMVPRVFKTNVGDIFTTNTINVDEPTIGMVLTPGTNGILEEGDGDMQWQVVKIYTMPDGQKGVKLMRIA